MQPLCQSSKHSITFITLFFTFMYSYCYVCSVLYILFPTCQLALFSYPDWGFSVLFLSCKANVRVQNAKMGHGQHSSQLVWPLWVRIPESLPNMPRPPHSSRCDYPKNIWWAVQIIKLLIMYFLQLPSYLVSLTPKILLNTPISNILRSNCNINSQS
jgi:hypothetical protein